MELYKKALPFFEEIWETWRKGKVYYKMGEIYLYKGNIILALAMYEKSLDIFEKTGCMLDQSDVYRGKGYIYALTGNYSRALEMYNKARHLYKEAGNRQGQGSTYLGEALVHYADGKYSKAIIMNDKAISLFDKTNLSRGKGWGYLGKAKAYLAINDFDKAEEMCQKALIIFEQLEYSQACAHVYESLGDIYFLKYEWGKAPGMYDKALAIYIKLLSIKPRSSTLLKKGVVRHMQGKKEEALMLFEQGFFYLDKFRQQTAFSPMKRTLMEEAHFRYEKTVEFLVEFKYDERAFKYAESIRARGFLDQLAEGLVKIEKGIAPHLKQKRDDFVAKLSLRNKEIINAAGKKDEEKLRELKEKRLKVEGEYEDLLIKIRLNNPLYASIRYPEPITVGDIQRNVLKKDELLIRYFIAWEKVYVFLISKKDFQVVTLGVTVNDINNMLNQYLCPFKKECEKRRLTIPMVTRWMINHGKTIYQSIFKPLESKLKRKKEIIIIPDGALAAIPLESLVIGNDNSGNPTYLLEKYRIKYIQSASTLAILRKHYGRDARTNHFIGFGDPVYDYGNFKQGKPEKGQLSPSKGDTIKEIHQGKYEREGGVLNRLQGSGQEVEVIAGLLSKKNQKTMVYLRENATETNAKAVDMKEYDYIHFSCHGILGDGFQSLVLSQIPGAKEDGYLTLNEIMNCHYNAKLVVLSACKTGSGKMERAEGVTGLTRAVMYAGTPAVVAGLWNVSEIATKELLVKFYTNMLEKGMKKEEALRQAKLEMIRGKNYSSPYFWSAFVMYGE